VEEEEEEKGKELGGGLQLPGRAARRAAFDRLD
jgi:hypothetical protein